MRSAVRPALAVLLLVGVGIAGVDLPDRPGNHQPCERCCEVADDGDSSARLPAVLPTVGVTVIRSAPVVLEPDPAPATPARAADVLPLAPKTSPPVVTA